MQTGCCCPSQPQPVHIKKIFYISHFIVQRKMHTKEKRRTWFFVLHQTNPSFALRTGREQSLGWTGGSQSPNRHPVPQRLPQAPVPALQRGDSAWRWQCPQIQPSHRLLLPRLTGAKPPQGCAVPHICRPSPQCAGEPCGLSSSNSLEERKLF